MSSNINEARDRTTTSTHVVTSPRLSWQWHFATALICLTALCIYVPFNPLMPEFGLDPSWRTALNEAVARGMLFGTQIVFTFGPYASIFTSEYHPGTVQIAFASSLYLAASYAACLRVITPRNAILIPLAVCVFVAFLSSTKDALLLSSAVLISIATCVLVNKEQNDRTMTIGELMMWVFIYSASGLLVLIKGTFLVACIATTLLNGIFALWKRARVLALISVTSPVVAALVFWSMVGQPIGQIVPYLASSFATASSYTEAMAIYGDWREIIVSMLAGLVVLASIAVSRAIAVHSRIFLLVSFGFFLLIAFKAGFVRHDVPHTSLFVRLMVFASLGLLLAFRARPLGASLAICLCTWLLMERHLDNDFATAIALKIGRPYADAAKGIRRSAENSSWQHDAYDLAMGRIRKASPLKELQGRTDIYSTNQVNLIATGAVWSPRPVFQSYAAYDAALAQRNADHLIGPLAPDNVIFNIEPTDKRLPALEDGASWPILMANYRATGEEDGLLYLKRQPAVKEGGLTTVDRSFHAIGETVSLPDTDELLYASFEIEATLLGRLVSFFYKTDVFTVRLDLADGQSRSFRFVPRMARSSFLFSPLIESTDDFARWFGVFDDLPAKRVVAFRLQPNHDQAAFWKSNYLVTIVRGGPNTKFDPSIRPRHASTQFELQSSAIAGSIETSTSCEGAIEAISRTKDAEGRYRIDNTISVKGWLRPTLEADTAEAAMLLTDVAGNRFLAPLRRRVSADLAGNEHRAEVARAGFMGTADLQGKTGDFDLDIAWKTRDRWIACRKFHRRVQVPVNAPDRKVVSMTESQ